MSTSWDDLHIFLAIARIGTLGGAAKVLGLSQPTMGRRIRALEADLGHALFHRTEAGFRLTYEGEAVLRNVEQMEDEANAVVRKLSGEQHLEGLLRISTTEWFGAHLLTSIVAEFCAATPGLVVELLSEPRLVSLARREADLVFRFGQFNEPDVIQCKAMHTSFGVYGHSAYLKRTGLPTDGGRGHTLITMNTAYDALADVPWIKARLPLARIAFRANSRDVQAKLCLHGGGLAVLPRCVGDAIGGLESIDLGEPPPGRDVWAGYHKDLKRSTRLRALLKAILVGLAKS